MRSLLRAEVGTLLLVALAGAASAQDAGDGCRGWCAAERQPKLDLSRVEYQVDVYGSVAFGRLTQSFYNAAKEPFAGSYRLPRTGLRLEDVELRVAGQVVEQEPLPKAAKGSRAESPARAMRKPDAQSPRVTVDPGAEAEVAALFRQELAVEKGLLRLRVPAPNLETLAGGRERLASPSGDPERVPVGLKVTIHHGEPLAVAESSTHEILVDFLGDRSEIGLATGDLEAREFVLDFAVGPDDAPTLLGRVGPARDGVREVVAVLTPPSKPPAQTARAKQVVFVLDTSGSMRAGKLDQARRALEASVRQLAEGDRFNIVEFDSSFTQLWEEPHALSEKTLELTTEWLAKQRPSGSTKLLPALASAFEQAQIDTKHCMIVVLTDGNVHDAAQVDELLKQKLGRARLFFVGVGEDMQQENLMRFAEIGRGSAAFAESPERIGDTVAVLFESVAQPLAWDLEIDWGGAQVERLRPERVPDLYAGRPVAVFATVRGDAPEELKLTATTVEGEQTFSVVLPPPPSSD